MDLTIERAPGLTAEDIKRADRIAALSARLWRLQELLKLASESGGRGVTLGPSVGLGKLALPIDITLRGVEAERLIGHMIDETSGELQALL